MKLFDMLTLRAGKMIPAYSILDNINTLLSRSELLTAPGRFSRSRDIFGTDAGAALGFDTSWVTIRASSPNS
jgi:hypothetical protein